MADRNQTQHDQTTARKQSPAINDIDPDGMDPETEGDELETGADGESDDGVEPDGVRDDRRIDTPKR